MKTLKKVVAVVLSLALVLSMTACSDGKKEDNKEEKKVITIAYQGGIGYAPIHVLETQKFIEANYDGEIEVKFQKLDSGAAINEGIIGGSIQIGCMGIGPAASGVVAGIPYKCISNLSAQSSGLMSNDPSIKTLADIKSEDKIALVNTGSIQHIILAMAADKYLGDPHALDNNIAPMSHAEGMAALESGTVKLQLTSSPFIYQERANDKFNELTEIADVWPSGTSFLIAMASTELEKDEKLFNAIDKAFDQAFDFINNNKDAFADIEVNYLGLDKDTVISYIDQPDCQFHKDIKGVSGIADFMYKAGFITSELKLDNFKFSGLNGD